MRAVNFSKFFFVFLPSTVLRVFRISGKTSVSLKSEKIGSSESSMKLIFLFLIKRFTVLLTLVSS